MLPVGQSDLASAMGLRSQHAHVKTALGVTGKELSTGLKGDLVKATGGDLGRLFSIERTLSTLTAAGDALTVANGKSALMQLSLGHIGDNLTDYGPELLSAVNRGDQHSMTLMSGDARHKLEAAVTALNARYGRHNVFSGAAVDLPAIAPAADILSDVSTIVAGAANAAAALTAIDTYFFAPGGGFETNIYLGAPQDGPAIRDENGAEINYAVRADATGVRESLRALAIAAAVAETPALIGTPDQVTLLREAANASINATGSIIEIREKLGFAEGALADATARNTAKSGAFELERTSIVAADPYESATMFEALQGQLETVYAVTAKLSNLSLTNFLR